MQYLNINVSTLHSPEYIGAEPVARATWLSLLGYAVQQEKGGRIADAKTWPDRQWQQTCCVTLEEVSRSCKLWRWHGSTLVVKFYPAAAELEVKAKRAAGKETARKRYGTPPTNPPGSSAGSSAGRKGKGKEDKQKEGTEAATAAVDLSLLKFPDPLNTPAFQAEWARWRAYWVERKQRPLTVSSAQAQLAELAKWGQDSAIQAIRTAIQKQWAAFFDPTSTKLSAAPATPREAPRFNDDDFRDLAKANPGRFASLIAQWPQLKRQAQRLGLAENDKAA